jgi:hypothetical protein
MHLRYNGKIYLNCALRSKNIVRVFVRLSQAEVDENPLSTGSAHTFHYEQSCNAFVSCFAIAQINTLFDMQIHAR